jgi:DNA polymerase gamma 1
MYGAGKTFAEKLLMQFNHQLSVDEAKQKADLMYSKTKGIRYEKIFHFPWK